MRQKMYAYVDWLFRFDGALNCHPRLPFAWSFVMVLLLVALDWLVALKFFYLKLSEVEARHGKLVVPHWVHWTAPFIVPIPEELGFRGPILWFCIEGDIRKAVIATILGAIAFGLIHRTNKNRYADGTILRCPWIEVAIITFGGLLCGCLVLITNSLWPGIAFHSLLNLSISLSETNRFAVRLASVVRKWN